MLVNHRRVEATSLTCLSQSHVTRHRTSLSFLISPHPQFCGAVCIHHTLFALYQSLEEIPHNHDENNCVPFHAFIVSNWIHYHFECFFVDARTPFMERFANTGPRFAIQELGNLYVGPR
jgi:hypothetical protein